ncbi:MAG: hypothetical protein JEY94_04335 [Melioribacteraceae bacterium]|nr:hypothetical protein [Melioribacteraceae bacterium]
MFKSFKKIFLLISAIVFVILMIGSAIYFFSLPPYDLEKWNVYKYGQNFKNELIFTDLNNDGETESLNITDSLYNSDITSFIIDSPQHYNEAQYNFYDFKLLSKIKTEEDLDSDGIDEIQFIHFKNDTVFYSVINHGKRKISLLNVPLYTKPKKLGDTKWDIMYCEFQYHNTDFEKRYLYFSVVAGYSIFPRSLFIYDLNEKKIVEEFETTIPISFRFADLNNDDSDEILIGSYSSNNTWKLNYNVPYPDTCAWFFLLDKDLKVKWKYSSDKNVSAIRSKAISDSNSTNIFNYHSPIDIKTDLKIVVYNYNGEVIDSLKLKQYGNGTLTRTNHQFKSFLFSAPNKIELINNELQIEKSVTHEKGVHLSQALFDFNNKMYLVFSIDRNLFVYDDDLDLIARTVDEIVPKANYGTKLSLKYSKINNEMYLGCISNNGTITYKFIKRNVFQYLLIVIAIFFFTLLFIFLIIKVGIRLQIYFRTVDITIKQSSGSILVINDAKKILSFNKSAKSLFGENLKRGMFLAELFSTKSIILSVINEAKIKGSEVIEEIDFERENKKFMIRLTITPIKIKFGLIIAYLIRLDDQTELIMRERSRVWFHSMQKIAHEIKTPLSSMLINLRSIEKNVDKPITDKEVVSKDVGTIKNEIIRIKTLTNNLLKFADYQKLNFQETDILIVIGRIEEKFSSFINAGIKFEVIINTKNTVAKIDAYQIEEVLQVLVENGIDAVGGKGEINIILEGYAEKLVITVKDYGKGIPREDLIKIFDPYFTTKKEGTGMGLAIARKIIKDHESELNVKSGVGKGTEFSFEVKT